MHYISISCLTLFLNSLKKILKNILALPNNFLIMTNQTNINYAKLRTTNLFCVNIVKASI